MSVAHAVSRDACRSVDERRLQQTPEKCQERLQLYGEALSSKVIRAELLVGDGVFESRQAV